MYSKSLFIALSVIAAYFSFIGIYVDKPFILSDQDFEVYKIGRIIWGSVNVGLVLLSIFNLVSLKKLVPAYLLNMMMYSIHGQFFVPCYYLGYLEIIMFVSLFFPLKKKLLYPTIIFSGLILSYIVSISPASYAETQVLKDKFIYDSIAAICIISFFSILAHNKITMVRKEKDVLFRKFIDIGKNSSFIIHDLKGLMMYPYDSLYELKYQLKDLPIDQKKKEELLNHIEATISDFNLIKNYTKEVTKLTIPSNEKETSKVSIKEILQSVQNLSYKNLNGINLQVTDSEINCNETKLKKILFNLIQNSVESLKENKIKNPTIEIFQENNYLVIQDNGIGFPPKKLKKLNKDSIDFFTTKNNGSGLGLSVVKELMLSNNLKYKFENSNGAKVSLELS